MIDEIKEFSKTFFDKLLIDLTSFDVVLENDDKYIIKIDTLDSNILIGEHGVIFENIQGILRTIFSNKYDKKIKINLKIKNYIHNKDSRLFSIIDSKIAYAKEVGTDVELPLLSAYERKKVHFYISKLNDSEIKSKSRGEGKNRKMFIILKNKEIIDNKVVKKSSGLSIDIDGNDI